jgi:hypothetical protein
MLRLIHQQTAQGAILVDDIDDGLPNKQVHRLGSNADPKAYDRDGYANKPKQACYVPRTMAGEGFPLVAGYIDLNETDRVLMSAGKGKIKGFQDAGYLDVVSFVAADLAAPVLTQAEIDVPGAGDLTIDGTGFLSVEPDITTVIITGDGAVTLTAADIIAGTGSVSATEIVIPAALVPGISDTTTSVQIQANQQLSAVVAVIT